jgi:dTDP-4-amino-4,6-dideoxygalactose transaminase
MLAAVAKVLASGRYVNGPIVAEFEQQFARYIGTSDCVACNSGTDALYLALRACGVGTGDEVITSPFTFIASAEVINMAGATPVFVDIDPVTFNLDLTQIEAAITDRTRAIIPVHLFGQPVDMTRLMAIAQSHNLIVIEDCAQAVGAAWQGTKVGSIGHIGCFSFYPTKNLGACGDGGAVTTNDEAIAQTIRELREHGQPAQYRHTAIGMNSRLDAIQAAILQIKLRHLDDWSQQRRAVAEQYRQLLEPVPGMVLPIAIVDGTHVWNQYTIRLTHQPQTNWRDQVRQALRDRGVISMVYYPIPLHLQPVYAELNYPPGSFPVAEQLAQEVLSLPMFPELTPEQQDHVVYALKDILS